ncbi:DUF4345 family protein [Fretibacter rubidus]|uniref:DUF4345 family protein n=1 Tax=Fretibacter rubidus TaxID=570162 RepID=UPI00352B3F43
MGALKFFVGLNGIFYLLYGLYGAFVPTSIAFIMGWTPSLLGLHEVRAIWTALAAMGLVILWTLRHASDLVPVVKAIMLVTAAFFVGRVLGLTLDGAGPPLTYFEMGLEIVIVLWGLVILRRVRV